MRDIVSDILKWPWFSEPHGYNFNGHLVRDPAGNVCIDPIGQPRSTWTHSSARYAQRDKVRIIGKEEFLEDLNRQALAIAQAVARESGALLAGNICNTNIYDLQDTDSHRHVRAMFEELVGSAEIVDVRDVATDKRAFFGPSATICRLLRNVGLLGLMMIGCKGTD